jgi:hypothetical protein
LNTLKSQSFGGQRSGKESHEEKSAHDLAGLEPHTSGIEVQLIRLGAAA